MIAVAPFVGSFLGVLVLRLPQERPVGWGRSVCDHCGHRLAARDLVPLASYLLLSGRCRYCRASIGWFAPAMELGAVAVAAWAAAVGTSGWLLVASCILGWMLLVLAVIDWRTHLLLDVLTLPLLGLGLAVAYTIDPGSWPNSLIGAAAGFAGMAMLAFVYAQLRGREGLGLGDAKLLAAIGAWVSWQGLATVLLWGSMLGLLYALMRAAIGGGLRLSDRLPFGTFLAAGGWIVWLHGPLLLAL